ncbi:disease resistance protein L6-like [Typha latifolia]|uniref:disease resistance protein L6-like n=1 Tax=Typha latifolia TaxID=4733 RepID=UPI003C2DE4CA
MALEELCGTTAGTTQWLPCLRNLWIQECPKLRLCPNLPCGLNFLHLASLDWAALPELWQGENINSLSMSSASLSLSNLTIFDCGRLVSLAEGLLVHPRPCKSLEELSIFDSAKLTHLPVGGFEEFTSLKELTIDGCPELQRGSASERFLLPPSLQLLSVYNCDALDPLPSASEDLPFLHSVALHRCAIESLPSAEVLGRWTALNELSLEKCPDLESLGGLQALSSLKSLKVVECPKLVAAASSSPSALVVEDPTSSSSSPCLILDKFDIDDPLMLRTLPLRSISARDVKIQFCDEARSSALEEWVLKNRTSLQKLSISNVSSRQFPVVNLQSLSFLEFLDIKGCNNLGSLPELPSSLEVVCLDDCSSELEERCLRDSGPDWPKIQRIPEVKIGKYSKEQLAATSPAEHRRPQLV